VSPYVRTVKTASGARAVRTARRYRTIQIQAGNQTITAADPLPDDLRRALERIHHDASAHQSAPSRVSLRLRVITGHYGSAQPCPVIDPLVAHRGTNSEWDS